ncbi:MAG: hypothetical protein AB1813_20655, partial [Verrucomicrobiota bacterium]
RVDFAIDHPPYTHLIEDTNLVTSHSVAITSLKDHAMYHFQVRSDASDRRPAISRDMVICTRPVRENLLANPGFEEGSGASPRSIIPGWSKSGNVDIRLSNGTWFWGVPRHSGQWLLQGAVNNNVSDAVIYQRVPVTAGKDYTFSAWVTTWMRENDNWKYDVWQERNRLIYMRLGIDPNGGINPSSSNVQWTPRMYSHLRYSSLSKRAVAKSNFITVFVSMKGDGGQWHVYGVDDCVLTETSFLRPHIESPRIQMGTLDFVVVGEPGTTNRLEASENLLEWQTITNWVQASGRIEYQEPVINSAASRFFRVVMP